MAFSFSVRSLLRGELRVCPTRRSIMSTPARLEKALEQLEKNPYFEKYAQKIAALQQTSPEEFLQRVEQQQQAKVEEEKKKFGSVGVDISQYSSVLNPKAPLNSNDTGASDKKLEDILKLELVQDKSAAEVQEIWETYHKSKDVIAATIPADTYQRMGECMKENPTFVLPLPRAQGYEFFMCQCWRHTVHFTPLLAYQVHKENAPECLTMTHYTELRDKGIVLMRGEYDKLVVSGREAACLATQFQLYYAGAEPARAALLQEFTARPDAFSHMSLVRQLEEVPLAPAAATAEPPANPTN